MSTGCALDENWVNIVVKNCPLFLLGTLCYILCLSVYIWMVLMVVVFASLPFLIILKWIQNELRHTVSYASITQRFLFKVCLRHWPLQRSGSTFNILRPRQYGRHFADDIFKCISLNENVWIPVEISLKYVPKGPINNIPALVQIMAWRRSGENPLSEPMMVGLPTHICVTRP